MKKVKALSLLILMLMSTCILMHPQVKAAEASAKVYIICLSDVPCRSFPDQESHTSKLKVKDGAIRAITFGEYYSLPHVHPKLGRTPPYYSTSYYVIKEWFSYKSVIESCNDAIIINTHGEILPIPSGYSAVDWINKIAEAMLKRRVTWVHTGGYPFYRVWYQGATQSEEWPSGGINGFKNFMSHINLNDVTCWPPGSETEQVLLNTHAENTLELGWDVECAYLAERGRPLKASDFKNYIILPIWGDEDSYLTGAVIAFVKPSERLLPSERRGFGAYVHIGTRKTFASSGNETDGDFYRGYVGAAVAIWTETLAFKPSTAIKEYSDEWGNSVWCLTAAPVITHYSYDGEEYTIKIAFGVYGVLKTSGHKYIGDVMFYLEYLPEGCRVMVDSSRSKNGYNYGKANIAVDIWEDVKLIASPWLFFIGLVATGPFELIVAGIEGVMLFSDYAKLAGSITQIDNGVDELQPPDDYIDFTFAPESFYTQPGDGYTYQEFQSIIFVELRVNMTNRKQWTIIPMQWQITMRDNAHYAMLDLNGDCSIALFKSFEKTSYKATVFFEDFNGDLSDWNVGDLNPLAGHDYWGIVRTIPPGCVAWCAAVGNNSIKSEKPNIEEKLYDKYMNAYMERRIDLRPYKTPVTLRYHLFYWISPGDYLAIEYYTSGSWHVADSVTGQGIVWKEAPIPTSAEKIRFRFYSNGDNNVNWGVYIHHIEIVAEMPNDANTNADAGDNFNEATYITHPNSYGGYLNYDEDWYMFDITSQNIAEGKIVYISIEKPEYATFQMELYDNNGQIKSSSLKAITYALTSSDSAGQWRLRIRPIVGFGPYAFRLELRTSLGGGGCPILFVRNGSNYVDYGTINMHNVEGYDVIKEIPVSLEDISMEGFVAKLRLKEGWEGLEYSHSSIDQVKLYAIDNEGKRRLCPLISAVHNEQGNILLELLFSDNQRVDIYLKQTIDLKFLVPYPTQNIQNYIFVIEGYNQEKIDY